MLKLAGGGAEYILWFPVGLAWLGLRGGYAKEKRGLSLHFQVVHNWMEKGGRLAHLSSFCEPDSKYGIFLEFYLPFF
jgi:hypothetical protein